MADSGITRRDYLNSTLVASGAALLGGASPMELLAQGDWNGYGGVGEYSNSNGNTFEVMTEAHKIRDRVFEPLPADIPDAGEQPVTMLFEQIRPLAAHRLGRRDTRLTQALRPLYDGRRYEIVQIGDLVAAQAARHLGHHTLT